MRAAEKRVVDDHHVAVRPIQTTHQIGHRKGHAAQMHRYVRGLRRQGPRGVEHRAGEVAAITNVRRQRGVAQHGAHLITDRLHATDEEAECNGTKARSSAHEEHTSRGHASHQRAHGARLRDLWTFEHPNRCTGGQSRGLRVWPLGARPLRWRARGRNQTRLIDKHSAPSGSIKSRSQACIVPCDRLGCKGQSKTSACLTCASRQAGRGRAPPRKAGVWRSALVDGIVP
jgi:hypothetical protein